jgi:20S proteasome alpha/beta subunit
MTICAAAFAAESKIIVSIADKALSYGDHIQWDSDSSKILKLSHGGLIMFAGNEDHASRVLAGLVARAEDINRKPRNHTIEICERAYKDSLDELTQAQCLTPRLLKKQEYLDSITGPKVNRYILSVAKEIDAFRMNCQFLICGFDSENKSFILDLDHPGTITDMSNAGFHAIGSGWDKAVARMLFNEHKREHDTVRVLYDSFDAKAHAEMAAGVGYEWDAVVSICSPVGFCDITQDIKDIVERAWSKFNRSPFEKHDRKKDLPLPPVNWKRQLNALMSAQVMSKLSRIETVENEKSQGAKA